MLSIVGKSLSCPNFGRYEADKNAKFFVCFDQKPFESKISTSEISQEEFRKELATYKGAQASVGSCRFAKGGDFLAFISNKKAIKVGWNSHKSKRNYEEIIEKSERIRQRILQKREEKPNSVIASETVAVNSELSLADSFIGKILAGEESLPILSVKNAPKSQSVVYKVLYLVGLKEKNVFKIRGPSHQEEAFLGNCHTIKIESPKELFSLYSSVINEVDELHAADVCHFDIKPANICKKKSGGFRVIDMYGSFDFKEENPIERLRKRFAFSYTEPYVSPCLYRRLEGYVELNNIQQVKESAKALDRFALVTTLIGITFAFTQKKSIAKKGECNVLPYHLGSSDPSQVRFASRFYKDEILDETLKVFPNDKKRALKGIFFALKKIHLGEALLGTEEKHWQRFKEAFPKTRNNYTRRESF